MTTEIVKQTTKEVALTAENETLWGSEGITAKEATIPKILLMQGLSKLVMEGDAKVGTYVDSLTKETLGGQVTAKENKPVEFIPLFSWRAWKVSRLVGEKFQYIKREPITMQNENDPIEYMENGEKFRRDKVLSFYVLRPEDVKAGTSFPYVISFQRKAMSAGKNLASFIMKLNKIKRTSASKVFALSVKKEENDKGTFFVPEISIVRDSSDVEYKEAFETYKMITQNHTQFKVHEDETVADVDF